VSSQFCKRLLVSEIVPPLFFPVVAHIMLFVNA